MVAITAKKASCSLGHRRYFMIRERNSSSSQYVRKLPHPNVHTVRVLCIFLPTVHWTVSLCNPCENDCRPFRRINHDVQLPISAGRQSPLCPNPLNRSRRASHENEAIQLNAYFRTRETFRRAFNLFEDQTAVQFYEAASATQRRQPTRKKFPTSPKPREPAGLYRISADSLADCGQIFRPGMNRLWRSSTVAEVPFVGGGFPGASTDSG